MNPSPLRSTNRFQPWLQHILTTQSWILVLLIRCPCQYILVHTRSFAVEVFFIKCFFFWQIIPSLFRLYMQIRSRICHHCPHSVLYGSFPNDTFHVDSFYGKGGFCLMLTVLPVHWWSTFLCLKGDKQFWCRLKVCKNQYWSNLLFRREYFEVLYYFLLK